MKNENEKGNLKMENESHCQSKETRIGSIDFNNYFILFFF